ncbi:A/B/D/E cyclin [Saccharata proteae CBS 121410]|uniref:A/B/D/E cyclin n=1 Tax=Saccharata proteae CBS 121410 TaxID=1314787 RepID=A0A6A5YDT1_9PEZI|nr:A/B/D/E cyclin [Saccharata proteae CBS 121410]
MHNNTDALTQARPASRRTVTNENDENATTTRVTRAKAAALTNSQESAADPPKKTTTLKKTTTASNLTRKRNALGDVSNVKGDVENAKPGKDGKDAKKPLASKRGPVAQAAAPTGIQKPSRSASTRTALGSKDKNNAAASIKRPLSSSSVTGHASKKPKSTVPEPIKEEDDSQASENTEPNKQAVKAKPIIETARSELQAKEEPALKHAIVEEFDTGLPDDVPDLDEEDANDPLMVSEYVCEIFDYLKELEITTMANPCYMDNQGELEWKMRGILVDWLLEVHSRFRLLPETLFLAVNIIDRFLSRKVVQLDRLQLVGVTAMFIASKYEEVLSPHVQNFRHVADDGFTEDEILSAERFVLAALDYDLSYPNPMNFLRRISKADNYDIQTRTLGKYLLEISCLDHRFIGWPPSQVAATAMYLSRLVLERGEWDSTLAHYSGYTEEEVQPVFDLMIDYLKSPVVHEAFFKKYASKKFMKASIVLRQWAKKYHALQLEHDANAKNNKAAAEPKSAKAI